MLLSSRKVFPLLTMPKDSPAIKILGLWFSVLVFFFSPEIIHAEFLDRLELNQHQNQDDHSKFDQLLLRYKHIS